MSKLRSDGAIMKGCPVLVAIVFVFFCFSGDWWFSLKSVFWNLLAAGCCMSAL